MYVAIFSTSAITIIATNSSVLSEKINKLFLRHGLPYQSEMIVLYGKGSAIMQLSFGDGKAGKMRSLHKNLHQCLFVCLVSQYRKILK